MIGTTLSHFHITAKLGEGGMGEVYRAEDTKLGREVAIKVLPAALTSDTERLARFEREARVLASLNHPNIAAIYEVGEAAADQSSDGSSVHFLAMELAEGEDLSSTLARGPLRLDAALPIAHDIASALEAAHDKGIVHRDLKPANVMVGSEGHSGLTVKVLDFGLAKAWDEEQRSASDLSLSPTLTAQMTQAGVILGTASYMSPEQARGHVVDRRADIWAFGVMLLEMLTGERTFAGETTTDVLAAVVRADPDLSGLTDSVPSRLVWLLQRCLEKDPQRRLRDIGEARVLLDDLILGTSVSPADEEEVTPGSRAAAAPSRSPWLVPTLLALVIGTLAFVLGQRTRSGEEFAAGTGLDPAMLVRKLTFHPGLQNEPSVSPDGNYVAYTSNEDHNLDIVVLPLAGGGHTPVVTHPADDAQPAWSPDGTQLAFTSSRDHGGRLSVMTGTGALTQFIFSVGGDVFLVPALGGTAVKLVENAAHPTWSPDGSQIAFESDRSGSWDIWTISTKGGSPTQLTDDRVQDFQPAFSPNGRWIAFGSLGGLSVVPASGGEIVRLTGGDPAAGPAWSPDGRWITFSIFRGGQQNLWRLPFDPDSGWRGGEMERVSLGVGDDVEAAYGPDGDILAYSTVRFTPDIWELDPSTRESRQVTFLSSHDDYPHLGPDGETVLLQSTRGGDEAIWASNRSGGSMRKITPDGIVAAQPRWSPDGSALLYVLQGASGAPGLVVHRLGEIAGRTIESEVPLIFAEWSPDGRRLAASAAPLVGILVIDLDTGSAVKLTDDDVEYGFPTWSPDGEWLAYNRRGDETRREVWVMRPDGSETRVLSTDPDLDLSHPQWSPANPDQILVVVDHENLGIVYVSTGELAMLTDYDDSTIVIDYPSWSVDGSLIHYSLARRRGDVFLMAPDPGQ